MTSRQEHPKRDDEHPRPFQMGVPPPPWDKIPLNLKLLNATGPRPLKLNIYNRTLVQEMKRT